jgi:hypothetical protein
LILEIISDYLPVLIAFVLVSIAGNQIAKVFGKIDLPLITGLLATGIIRTGK